MNDPTRRPDAGRGDAGSDTPARGSAGSDAPARGSGGEPQRERLLDSERAANRDQPRNFKDDALSDKRVHIDPDGTGPSPTHTMDPERDRAAGRASADRDRREAADPAAGDEPALDDARERLHGGDAPEPRDEGPLESLGRAISAPVIDAEQRVDTTRDGEAPDRSGAADTPRTG